MESVLLDAVGHRRSTATVPGCHRGHPPRNKGDEHPADPPAVEEIVAVMRTVSDRPEDHRLRAVTAASNCITRPPLRASGAGSHRTSYGMPTQSRWPTRASRSW